MCLQIHCIPSYFCVVWGLVTTVLVRPCTACDLLCMRRHQASGTPACRGDAAVAYPVFLLDSWSSSVHEQSLTSDALSPQGAIGGLRGIINSASTYSFYQ